MGDHRTSGCGQRRVEIKTATCLRNLCCCELRYDGPMVRLTCIDEQLKQKKLPVSDEGVWFQDFNLLFVSCHVLLARSQSCVLFHWFDSVVVHGTEQASEVFIMELRLQPPSVLHD